MKKLISIFSIVLFVFSVNLIAQPFEYNIYTSRQIKVKWDIDNNADSYEIKLRNISNLNEIDFEGIINNEVIITIPKVGVYEIQGRLCKVINDGKCCSNWSLSTNPSVSLVNNNSRAWVIRATLAPAGKPKFE